MSRPKTVIAKQYYPPIKPSKKRTKLDPCEKQELFLQILYNKNPDIYNQLWYDKAPAGVIIMDLAENFTPVYIETLRELVLHLSIDNLIEIVNDKDVKRARYKRKINLDEDSIL